MKSFGFALLIVGIALLAVPATAADAGRTSFELKGHTDGADNHWTEGTATTKNPTLDVPASTPITVTFSSVTGTHQLKVGDGASSAIVAEGDAAVTYTFTSPASGNVKYVCPLHGDQMSGQFHVAGSSTETPSKSPGLQVVGVVLALAGAALLVGVSRRK